MASNILKFHPSNLITGINIIDDMLFFTDGINEPKKIDLDIFRAADHSSGNTVVYGRNFQERDITVIRPHPQTAIQTSISNSTAVIDPIAAFPEVTTEPATGLQGQAGAVTLRGTSRSGNLPFTSRGFYYVQSDTDINDKDIIKATGTLVDSDINGFDFATEITGLTLTKRYYYIAWAQNDIGNQKVFATDTLGQDDIESFVVQDIANTPGGSQLDLETANPQNHIPDKGNDVVLGATEKGGGSSTDNITYKGFFVYRTQITDTQDFAQNAGNLQTLVSNLAGSKSVEIVESLPKDEFRFFNSPYEIDPNKKHFISIVQVTSDEKIFVQAFAGTGKSNAIEELGQIKVFPVTASTDPNLKPKVSLPKPQFILPFDQNGTSITMKARLDRDDWRSTARHARGFYFSKKEFTVDMVVKLLASSNGFAAVTQVDIPINGKTDGFIDIEWSKAVDNPDIYRAKTLWERVGYMGDFQEFDLNTSNIAGFTLTKDESVWVMPFGVSNHGEGYEREGQPAVRQFKAGASNPKVPVTIKSDKIQFIGGKIQVDFTIAFEQGLTDANKPIRAGVYFTSQDEGIALGNGANINKQNTILSRQARKDPSNNRIARALYTEDINNNAILTSGKVNAGSFQVQYGADITATTPGAGVARVSSTLPMERKEYYAMPFVEFDDGRNDIFGYVLGPPKLGRVNDPPQIRTRKATNVTKDGSGNPVLTFNGEIVPQLSNTPTLTEAGFIYATADPSDAAAQKTAAESVAAGTASTLVAVSNSVTSNTPNSIALLNSYLGQQGTAGQTPIWKAQKTFTGEQGKLVFYIAYVKLSGTGTTLHLAQTDDQAQDYGKGVVRAKLVGTVGGGGSSTVGVRLPIPQLETNPQPTTSFGCTFVAKRGDDGGANLSLHNMTPKFYYMRKEDVPSGSQSTPAAKQAYMRQHCRGAVGGNNATGTPDGTSGVVTVNSANDLTAQDNIVSVKMGEGSNPKLNSDTVYYYFITTNNGFSGSFFTNPSSPGEGPSANVFQFRTNPFVIPFDKSDHANHTCVSGCRAFMDIVGNSDTIPVTETTADIEVKWTGGGGTKNFVYQGIFLIKTSDMLVPFQANRGYFAVHVLHATNPVATFHPSIGDGHDTIKLTGLEKATSYHVLAVIKNDNTLTTPPVYNTYDTTGNGGFATLTAPSGSGINLVGAGINGPVEFKTEGSTAKPIAPMKVKITPGAVYLKRDGTLRKATLPGSSGVGSKIVSLKVNLSPSTAILKEKHISFPGADLFTSPIQVSFPGGKKVLIRKDSQDGAFIIDLKFAGFTGFDLVKQKQSVLQIDHPGGNGVSAQCRIFQSND
tara:strand:+ start:2487 stop:6452 length:3966 start_codon:yes stop_codon:yes gene_type:complete